MKYTYLIEHISIPDIGGMARLADQNGRELDGRRIVQVLETGTETTPGGGRELTVLTEQQES